jgi:basic membrane protein A
MSEKKTSRGIIALLLVIIVIIAGVAIYYATLPPTSPPPPEKPKLKVALILGTGGLGDKGFNDLGYAGCMKAKEELGVEFDYVEPRAVAEFEGFLRNFAKSGEYALIIGLGYYEQEPMSKVAEEYPNQKFAIVDAIIDKPNVMSLMFKEREGLFLAGVAAGMMTKNQKIGFVGGMNIPTIRVRYEGFRDGAKWANPAVEVLPPLYVGAWNDPTTAKEMALALYNQGADVVIHVAGGSGLGVFAAAEEVNKLAMGSDADQCYISPNHIFGSILKKTDSAIFMAIKSVRDGTFEGKTYWLGIKEGGYDMCGMGTGGCESKVDVPDIVREKINEAKQKIISGEIVIPHEIE